MTTVLVIDDEAPIRLLCRVNLEAEGMNVLEASDGPTGLEKARNEHPDVILLDVMMPGLDGWQVAEELIDSEPTSSIPIVFLTARAEARDRARGLDLGGIDYVTKPFNPVELAPLVRELIHRVDRGEREEVRREKIAELRDLNAPWLNVFVRSIALECPRAARSSRASIRSGARPWACRASFIACRSASSARVGVPFAWPAKPESANTNTTTTVVRTRRGTSAADVSRPSGRKPERNLCLYTLQTPKFVATSEKFAISDPKAR